MKKTALVLLLMIATSIFASEPKSSYKKSCCSSILSTKNLYKLVWFGSFLGYVTSVAAQNLSPSLSKENKEAFCQEFKRGTYYHGPIKSGSGEYYDNFKCYGSYKKPFVPSEVCLEAGRKFIFYCQHMTEFGATICRQQACYSSCFSKNSTVRVKNDKDKIETKKIADLKVGDWVESSKECFSKVISLGHHNPEQISKFLVIQVEGFSILEITPEHHVYIICDGQQKLVFAQDLKAEDNLIVNGEAKEITEIQKDVTHKGVFAPKTACGDIVVNGFKAGCYAEIDPEYTKYAKLYFMVRGALTDFACSILNLDEKNKYLNTSDWELYFLEQARYFCPGLFAPEQE